MPSDVRILKLSALTEVLGMSLADCKKYGTPFQLIFKMLSTGWAKVFGNALPIAVALAFQKNIGDYDVVISYHQEQNSKTMVAGFGQFSLKKCTAKKKIAWIHADFLATKLGTKRNLKTYKQFDKIVAVSKTSMEQFVASFPELRDKSDYCYNPLPVDEIINSSKTEDNVFAKQADDIILFSACRLVREKGLIPAIENLRPVFEKNRNLKWFIAGIGPEETSLRDIIQNYRLTEQVHLLGFKQNPYPYMQQADYMFLPSLHETFGMVAGEAHILGTPVIASDIPVMREVLCEADHLCVNGDFATVIQALLENYDASLSGKSKIILLEWKEQFERVLE